MVRMSLLYLRLIIRMVKHFLMHRFGETGRKNGLKNSRMEQSIILRMKNFFESRLKQLNLDSSHLHCNHAGNACLFAETDTEVLVQEKELTCFIQLESERKKAHNFFFFRLFCKRYQIYNSLWRAGNSCN